MSPAAKRTSKSSPQKVAASRAKRTTQTSLEKKLKQRGMSEKQIAAFSKNASRHQGAENDGKGKVSRTTVKKATTTTRRTSKRGQ